MSILIDKKTRVVVQGITGRDGSFHTRQMAEYGTNVVAGVTPGKGGENLDGIPIYNTVAEAVQERGANTSVIYVPVKFAVDAIYEAADAGCQLIVCITEGIPTIDMGKIYRYLKTKGVRLVGPNCPGLITPGVCKVGIMPGPIVQKGNVGLVSRSGTLTYEVVHNLTLRGIGQSTCIGIGGDPIIGTNFIDCLEMFEADKNTKAIVLIGEIGGTDEEEAAQYIKKQVTKPVVGFIAGRTAPPGKRMGHAGAIIAGGSGTAAEKIRAFRAVGVEVAETPAEVAEIIECELQKVAEKKKSPAKGPKIVPVSRRKPAKKAAKSRTKRAAKKAAKKSTARRKTTRRRTAKKAAAKRRVAKKRVAKKKAAKKKATRKKVAKKKTTRRKVAKKRATKKRTTKRKTVKKKTTKRTTKKKTKRAGSKKKTSRKKPAKKRTRKRNK